MLLATKFEAITIKRTESREFRVAYKLETIKSRLGVFHARAVELQELMACYESDREAAEDTARRMLRDWCY